MPNFALRFEEVVIKDLMCVSYKTSFAPPQCFWLAMIIGASVKRKLLYCKIYLPRKMDPFLICSCLVVC